MNLNLFREQREAARRWNEMDRSRVRQRIETETAQRRALDAEHALSQAEREAEIERTTIKASDPSTKVIPPNTRRLRRRGYS
jgi:lipase chaperone LimK